MAEKQEIYLGNPNLKRANVATNFSPEEGDPLPEVGDGTGIEAASDAPEFNTPLNSTSNMAGLY